MKKALVTLAAAFLFCSTLMAQQVGDDESSRKSLKGLTGVTVIVADLNPDVEQAGLSGDQIKTDVELRLRVAGIRVFDKTVDSALDKELQAAGFSLLYIVVSTGKAPDAGLYDYDISIGLQQDVIMARDHLIRALAVTWDARAKGMVGAKRMDMIRDRVKDCMDKFINAYLSVNPKK